jgi:ABC-type phosphate transport system auxiliary subunit
VAEGAERKVRALMQQYERLKEDCRLQAAQSDCTRSKGFFRREELLQQTLQEERSKHQQQVESLQDQLEAASKLLRTSRGSSCDAGVLSVSLSYAPK